MFDSIGWGEIMILLLGALFIFGPDRLPTLARDAADALKRVRQTVTGARGQLHEQLGPEFDHLRDVDLRALNPKTFVRKHLLEDEAPTIHRRSNGGSRARTATATTTAPPSEPDVAATSNGAAATAQPASPSSTAPAPAVSPVRTPFDAEAT